MSEVCSIKVPLIRSVTSVLYEFVLDISAVWYQRMQQIEEEHVKDGLLM